MISSKKILSFQHDSHTMTVRDELASSLLDWCKSNKIPLREIETVVNPESFNFVSLVKFDSLDAEIETYIRLRWGAA